MDDRKKISSATGSSDNPDLVTMRKNLDDAIIGLGIDLVEEAKKTVNHDHKFKLVDAIVKLRGALPPTNFHPILAFIRRRYQF